MISGWVHVVELGEGQADVFAWRVRGTDTGLFVAREGAAYVFGSYDAQTRQRESQQLEATFSAPTHVTLDVDYEKHEASFLVAGKTATVKFTAAASPEKCDLLVGIAWASGTSGRWAARYDDVVVRIDP